MLAQLVKNWNESSQDEPNRIRDERAHKPQVFCSALFAALSGRAHKEKEALALYSSLGNGETASVESGGRLARIALTDYLILQKYSGIYIINPFFLPLLLCLLFHTCCSRRRMYTSPSPYSSTNQFDIIDLISKVGNCIPLGNARIGTWVHWCRCRLGQGGKMVRAAFGIRAELTSMVIGGVSSWDEHGDRHQHHPNRSVSIHVKKRVSFLAEATKATKKDTMLHVCR